MISLRIEDLHFSYGSRAVLKKITFDVAEGDFVGIVGPNGSGKTTLLKLLQRLYIPDRGKIFLDGLDMAKLSSREVAKKIGSVWQRPTVVFPFTVKQFVMLGRTPYLNLLKRETGSDERVVEEAMRQTDCLTLKDRSVLEISAGEFQRVCIATALAQQPEILLLDEPTSFLDLRQSARLSRLLFELQKRGITVICASHDLAFLREHAGQVLLLAEGVQIDFGSYERVLSEEKLTQIFELNAVENVPGMHE